MTARWEPVIGLEIHVQLKTRDEDVLPLPQRLRRRAEHADLPGVPCVPRRAAGAEPARDRGDDQARPRARLRRSRSAPSSTARTTSIPTCRRRTRSASTTSRCARTAGSRSRRRTATSMIGITRAHLEEDAAKNVHVAASGRLHGATATLVDFNRGGTPLVEIVTEPDLHDAETAKRFLQLLRQTVVELELSDAELEKGSMRFDVNVSVRPAGTDELRTRTELKNMNSFNFAAKGIEREIARQIQIYEAGGEVQQETLHFVPGDEELAAVPLQGGGAGLPLLPRARPRAGAAAGGARRAAARRDRRAARARAFAASPTRCRSTTPTCSSPAGSTGSGRRSSQPGPTRRKPRTCSPTSSSPRASPPTP